jgi:hypothetical protein
VNLANWLSSAAAQPIPEAQFSWQYGAEALFFLGIAYGLMRWVGRTLRESAGGASDREIAFHAEMLEQYEGRTAAAQTGGATSERRTSRSVEGVHCPGCGRPLSAVPRALPFSTTCSGCGSTVHVRGDGPGRMGIVLEKNSVPD